MTAENPAFGPVSDRDRSIPPLDEHLKTLTIEKTRIGKVYDFLLGESIKGCNPPYRISEGVDPFFASRVLTLLAATEAYHELPNRKRLVELVEKAMPKEGAK